MTKEILFAGFGGQGILSMGKILAHAAVNHNYNVTWLPSYGPEQRGGTSNVTVVLSDSPISSPIVDKYDIVVALNSQSVRKFTPSVKAGGSLVYDTFGVTDCPVRNDISVYPIDATQTSVANNMQKTKNSLVLGALLNLQDFVGEEDLMEALGECLPARYADTLPLNRKAIELGETLIQAE